MGKLKSISTILSIFLLSACSLHRSDGRNKFETETIQSGFSILSCSTTEKTTHAVDGLSRDYNSSNKNQADKNSVSNSESEIIYSSPNKIIRKFNSEKIILSVHNFYTQYSEVCFYHFNSETDAEKFLVRESETM